MSYRRKLLAAAVPGRRPAGARVGGKQQFTPAWYRTPAYRDAKRPATTIWKGGKKRTRRTPPTFIDKYEGRKNRPAGRTPASNKSSKKMKRRQPRLPNKWPERFEDAVKLVQDATKVRQKIKSGNSEIHTLPPKYDDGSKFPKLETMKVSKTMKKGPSLLSGVVGKNHRVETIETGKPTTRTLKRLASQNGTKTITVFDTLTNTIENELLNHSHGINQKGFWFPPSSCYVNMGRLKETIGITPSVLGSQNEQETFYASVMNVQQEMVFHNQNTSLPLKLKVHWIQCKDPEIAVAPYQRMANSLFHTDVDIPDATGIFARKEKIPVAYQHSNLVRKDSAFLNVGPSYEVLTSTKINPFNESPAFRNQFKVAKTSSMTIDPGDTWTLRLTHHCGPGINLKDMIESLRDELGGKEEAGYSYYPVIETQGITVEAVRNTLVPGSQGVQSRAETFIVPGPGYLKVEYKTKLTYVKKQYDVDALFAATSFSRSEVHVRVFTTDHKQTSTVKEIFALPQQIKTALTAAIGEWYIPVVKDHEIGDAGPRHEGADRSSEN